MAITVKADMPRVERISRNLGILCGTIDFGSSYPTGGEDATSITGKFRNCLRVICDQKGGYLFEFDKTNSKIKVLYPTNPPAHAHDLVFKANATTNAVTVSTNSLRNASAADVTVAGAGADGGIMNTTPPDAVGAEVGNGTDLSGLTGVSFIAVGLV